VRHLQKLTFSVKQEVIMTVCFRYCLLADYESYIKCQERVSEVFQVSSFTAVVEIPSTFQTPL